MVRLEEEGRIQRVYEDAEARGSAFDGKLGQVIPVRKRSQQAESQVGRVSRVFVSLQAREIMDQDECAGRGRHILGPRGDFYNVDRA